MVYTTRNVADMLGVKQNTVGMWRTRGKIPMGKNLGAQIIYTEEEFEQIKEVYEKNRPGRPKTSTN